MTLRIVCLGGLTRCEGSLVGVIEATFGISHLEREIFSSGPKPDLTHTVGKD